MSAARRSPLGAARSATRSGNARCCSGYRWPTTGRRPRRISSRSSSGCSPSPGRSSGGTGGGGGPSRRSTRLAPRRGPGRSRSGEPPSPATTPDLPIPPAARTRFAPAPTGFLHLGHVANALWVWGAARRAGAAVLLRIEDHDRGRSREPFVGAILDDLAWLGFVADEGPVRQTTPDATGAYEAALGRLAADGLVYRCACTRSTFAAWARDQGRSWSGPGCPGACRTQTLPGDELASLRVALDDGPETFDDLIRGPQTGPAAADGDLVARDRVGNWTYGFAVVVDDLRQDVDLVIRGDDLLPETARQIRL